jgi:SAM-dependent methyltransferase
MDPFVYDQIHSSAGRDLEFYSELALAAGGRILEIACGTGRLTLPLAQKAFDIVGLDISAPMIEEAKRKTESLKAGSGKALKVEWHVGDCRDFSLKEKFPLVFIPCNSLQHLYSAKDVAAFLGCVKKHLAPGGKFALDVFKPDLSMLSRDPGSKHHVMMYLDADGREVSLDEKTSYDHLTQINKIVWFHSLKDGTVLRTDHFQMRQYFPAELTALLEAGGFAIEERFGAWGRVPTSNQTTKQILILSAI